MEPLTPVITTAVSLLSLVIVERSNRLDRHALLLDDSGHDYRLQGKLNSLFDLAKLVEPLRGQDIVWITDTVLVSKAPYRSPGLMVCVRDPISRRDRSAQLLFVYANPIDDALFDVLGIINNGFPWATQSFLDHAGSLEELLPDSSLIKMVQQIPENAFRGSVFSASQVRILAGCEDIAFVNCDFLDGGKAIWEMAREEKQVSKFGRKRLEINARLPFHEQELEKIGQCCQFNELHWEHMQVKTGVCRFFTAATIKCLRLYRCKLDDDGQTLFQSIQEGKGPQELKIEELSQSLNKLLISLASAVGNNSCLRHLWLRDRNFDDGFWKALGDALPNTRGLLSLHISTPCILKSKCDQGTWDQVMGALSTHPTLRTVAFPETTFVPRTDLHNGSHKIIRTRALANMLQVNSCIDDITPYDKSYGFQCSMYDQQEWAALVEPRLEHNKWRHRFRAILGGNPSTLRAALVGRAIHKLQREKSWALWLLLCQNVDIIGSHVVCSEESLPPGQE